MGQGDDTRQRKRDHQAPAARIVAGEACGAPVPGSWPGHFQPAEPAAEQDRSAREGDVASADRSDDAGPGARRRSGTRNISRSEDAVSTESADAPIDASPPDASVDTSGRTSPRRDTKWLGLRGPHYRRALALLAVGIFLMWRANTSWYVVEDRSNGLLDNGVTTQATVRAVHGGLFRSRLTVEFQADEGNTIRTTVPVSHPLPVGSVVDVSYDPNAPTSLILVDDYTNTSEDWSMLVLLLGLGLCIAAPVSALRTFRRKRPPPPAPPPPVTPQEIAKALRDRAKPWSGRGPAPWVDLVLPRQAPDAWQAFDTAIGARYRWVRGHQLGPGAGTSLMGAGGEVVASLVSTKHATLVMIDGVAVYERQNVRGGWDVTEVDSGDLVLTSCGEHISRKSGTEFRFPDGRTLWFPVTVGTQRDVNISNSGLRRVGVMFGVDERSRQVCMARTRMAGWLLPRSEHEIDVVLCGDRTRVGLLVALMAAPLLTAYFKSPGGGG